MKWKSFGKWLAGIVGTVIAGVVTVLMLNQITTGDKPSNPPTNTRPEPQVEAPHAPVIEARGSELFDEGLQQIHLEPSKKKHIKAKDLWSAPLGAQPSCASAFLKLTWQQRVPFPDSSQDLEFHRTIPMGGGRTEMFESGPRGSTNIGYCGEIFVYNTSLSPMVVELRYASGLHR
ncbi:MAG: hypothetical protein NMNS01_15710 [Nitrosomonas sp.]|nr:MAG: hypothetical protein NMNS01_15710 [Nitrosomonas sp.]